MVERPADQNTITRRSTLRAVDYIKKNKDKPFFLYLAHSMPHIPLFVSEEFRGKSLRGLYGDVLEEIDWGVGEILKTIKGEGIEKDTIVVFTTDNGPWLAFKTHGGSAGPLRAGKGRPLREVSECQPFSGVLAGLNRERSARWVRL